MSYDLTLKFRSPPDFDITDFEKYLSDNGIYAEMSPDFDIAEDDGHIPFRLCGRTFDTADTTDYCSGFELYAEYRSPAPLTWLDKLRGKKPGQPWYEIMLCCHDTHEIMLAHAFCAYMLKRDTTAEYDDPQGTNGTAQSDLGEAIETAKKFYADGKQGYDYIFESWE